MNKNIFKKTIGVLLVISMLLSLCIPAFASEEEITPVIVIGGMNSFDLVDTATGESVFAPSMDDILAAVGDVALPLIGSIFTNDWSILADGSLERIGEVFAAVACDENGEPTSDLYMPSFDLAMSNYLDQIYFEEGEAQSEDSLYFYSTKQQAVVRGVASEIGWDNTYYFCYDWRLSPVDLASDLEAMIEQVKLTHDCDKVSVIAVSMGGDVLTTYLDQYSYDSLDNIVYAGATMNGVDVVGELYSGDVEITFSEVIEFVGALIDVDLVSTLLEGVTELANTSILGFDSFETNFNDYFSNVIDEIQVDVFEDIFMDTFCAMYGMWAMMPSDYYEAAKEYMSSFGVLSDEFFEKTDEYYQAQLSLEDNLIAAQAAGVDVYTVASYSSMAYPVTSGSDSVTDGLVDTDISSWYCTVANYGETLADLEYESCTNCSDPTHNHISTDNIIDASTALFPEATWVISGMVHVDYEIGTATNDLIVWLATSEESVDIYTNENYPQFVEYDSETGSFSSLTYGVIIPGETQEESFLDVFLGYFNALIQILTGYFNEL